MPTVYSTPPSARKATAAPPALEPTGTINGNEIQPRTTMSAIENPWLEPGSASTSPMPAMAMPQTTPIVVGRNHPLRNDDRDGGITRRDQDKDHRVIEPLHSPPPRGSPGHGVIDRAGREQRNQTEPEDEQGDSARPSGRSPRQGGRTDGRGHRGNGVHDPAHRILNLSHCEALEHGDMMTCPGSSASRKSRSTTSAIPAWIWRGVRNGLVTQCRSTVQGAALIGDERERR